MIIYISKQAKRKLDTLDDEQINELFANFVESTSLLGLSVNANSVTGARLSLTRPNEAELKRLSQEANVHMSQLAAVICTHMLGANALESYWQAYLQKAIGGTREVVVPSGRVDLITSTHCIEVKMAPKYKAAIGQALSYQVYKPGLKPAIALIGKLRPAQERVCRHICDKLGISIIWLNYGRRKIVCPDGIACTVVI